MKEELLLMRLFNDIQADETKEQLQLVNQEEDLFVQNSHNKKGWKYFINGGLISKNTNEYTASYSFDFTFDYELPGRSINFTSYIGSSGLNFLNFINEVLNADLNKFVWMDGLKVLDTRKRLLIKKSINIVNSVVDDSLLSIIGKYFKNLEKIEFRYCTFSKSCNFNNLKNVELYFENCKIPNINIFDGSNNNLTIYKSCIENISPCSPLVESIDMYNCNIDFRQLFLKCNFKKLKKLYIDYTKKKYYHNDFQYIDHSAPYLSKLRIVGIFDNVNFISNLRYLTEISLASLYDDNGLEYSNVINKKEYDKIKSKFKEQVQIDKILHENDKRDEKYFVTEYEIDYQRKLASFYRSLSFTKEEEKALKDSFGKNIDYYMSDQFDKFKEGYYKTRFDELYFFEHIDKKMINFESHYHMINNFLYYSYGRDDKKKIVNGKNYIYYIDGHPIILEGYFKPIRNVEKAIEFVQKHKPSEKFDLDKYNFDSIIKQLKSIGEELDTNDDIDIWRFIEMIQLSTESDINLNSKKIIEYLKKDSNGRSLAYILEKHNLQENTIDKIKNKQKKKCELLSILIYNIYDFLTIEEKKYIFKSISSMKNVLRILRIHNYKDDEVIDCKDSLNLKTDGFFSKYLNVIKECEIQLNNSYNYRSKLYYSNEKIKKLSLIK